MHLRIVHHGQFTLVQDLGRHGHASMGVRAGGAADSLSIRVGNRLVANSDNAAALEMTYVGATVEPDSDVVVVLTGTRAAAVVTRPSGVLFEVGFWSPFTLRAGERLRIAAMQGAARAYLCVRGGIDVPVVLSGRGTDLSGEFGGHHGRRIRDGDDLPIGRSSADAPGSLSSEHVARIAEWLRPAAVLVTPAPHASVDSHLLYETEFCVDPLTSRTGIRLRGAGPVGTALSESEPAAHGFIEATPSGQPIILGSDAPTTGGYPVIACVASVHLPALGQLRPRDLVRFQHIEIDHARELLREREAELNAMIPPIPEPRA